MPATADRSPPPLATLYSFLALGSAIVPSRNERQHHKTLQVDPMILPASVVAKSPGLDSRVAQILDSLASICVARREKQVYAVAAQIERSTRVAVQRDRVILTVAENNGYYTGVEAHLKAVWDILRKISNDRHAPNPPHDDFCDESPKEGRTEPTNDRYVELLRKVHRHSFPKFLRRMKKAQVLVLRFSELLRSSREKEGDAHKWAGLWNLASQLNHIAHILGQSKGDYIDDPEFPITMRLLSHKCNQVFSENSDGERTTLALAQLFKDQKDLDALTFMRRIRKVIDLQRHTDNLARMGGSRRMYRLFGELKVNFVTAELADYELPKDAGGWRTVLQEALRGANLEEGPRFEKLVEKTTTEYAKCHSGRSYVHCEINIVKYFTCVQNIKTLSLPTPVPPISYIGVSKLSCTYCDAFLEVYNSSYPAKFQTRGVSGNSYFPWKFPDYFTDSLLNSMYDHVLKVLSYHLLDAKAARRLSDSSCMSDEPLDSDYLTDTHRAFDAATMAEYSAELDRHGNPGPSSAVE